MTKREAYFKDDITPNQAYQLLCDFIEYYKIHKNYDNLDEEIVWNFLGQRTKPALTDIEKHILESLKDDYITIYRNSQDNKLGLKYVDRFFGLINTNFNYFDNSLFQFIKSGEEYNIVDLLTKEM